METANNQKQVIFLNIKLTYEDGTTRVITVDEDMIVVDIARLAASYGPYKTMEFL